MVISQYPPNRITNDNMKEANKMKWEIREIDAYIYGDDWTYNATYHFKTFDTRSNDLRRAFMYQLKKKGVIFKKNRTIISYDGDCYEVLDRKTGEPLFIMYPVY